MCATLQIVAMTAGQPSTAAALAQGGSPRSTSVTMTPCMALIACIYDVTLVDQDAY